MAFKSGNIDNDCQLFLSYWPDSDSEFAYIKNCGIKTVYVYLQNTDDISEEQKERAKNIYDDGTIE